jgi:hypothetical protein
MWQTTSMRQIKSAWLYMMTTSGSRLEMQLPITKTSLDMILRHFHLQQNYFNPMYENSEILIICHLRGIVPRLEVLFFTRRRPDQRNRHISGTFKKASKSMYINCGIFWPLVSSINFLEYKGKKKNQWGPRWPLNPQMNKISKWSSLVICCTAPYGSSNIQLHLIT